MHCKKYYGKKLKPLIVLEFYLIRQNAIRSNGMYTNYTTTSNKALPLRMFSYKFLNEKKPLFVECKNRNTKKQIF